MNNINEIFNKLRNESIVIGLTGAVGSGCTTTAKFLSMKYPDDELNGILNSSIEKDEFNIEYRRSLRVKKFYNDTGWKEFYHIKVSDILFLLLVSFIDDVKCMPKIKEIIGNVDEESDISKIFNMSTFDSAKKLSNKFIEAILDYKNTDEDILKILEETNNYIEKNIKKNEELYTSLFQAIGKNIRINGSIYLKGEDSLSTKLKLSKCESLPIFIIPELIRLTMKMLRRISEKDFFVIDALRNTYEIEYFRNRYQPFYLLSIQADEEIRKERVFSNFELKPNDLESIRNFEKSSEGIESQSINSCIGKGDIFIDNNIQNESKSLLYKQLIKYIALIRKPGLFTPTDDERFMQLAFTGRYSSGCISRQVGATITGADGYLRGFGWNDVPEDHISCLYRTPQQLLNNDSNFIFSEYERSEDFYKHISETLQSKVIQEPYCFKDQQNQIELNQKVKTIADKSDFNKDDIEQILKWSKFKNPTRERALHAEENAFLQIAKSGGQSVVGGTLYTTDSPCQLCSKKAMQLKIKRIVYIDAYPDISEKHTLKAGLKEVWPDFDMFSGAIGSAYFKLFIPLVGIKDEVKMLS